MYFELSKPAHLIYNHNLINLLENTLKICGSNIKLNIKLLEP